MRPTVRTHISVSLFAAMLAAAGIPLYIHLPRFAASELGLSLSTVGAVLIGIRIMDFVQDPLLGRLVDRFARQRRLLAGMGVTGMAAGFVMLFSIPPAFDANLWLAMALVLLFTAYSLASILFYAQGVAIAGAGPAAAHYRLAGFRETGMLAGVVLAAAAPTVLAWLGGAATAYRDFGLLLAALTLVVGLLTAQLWSAGAQGEAATPAATPALPLSVLATPEIVRLLVLALINALPVAITSTLFLFFVEDRLKLPALSGLFLLAFFLMAGVTVPIWSRLVTRHGPKRVLVPAMLLAIVSFIGAAILPAGAAVAFGAISLASGAALGADMAILPALFAVTLANRGLPAGAGFGLWSFASKLALAVAAAAVLPALQAAGFTPGGPNTAKALGALTFAYAVLPCLLKFAAIVMVLKLPA